jgi:predicted AAA+ superfamily ATPase
MESGAMAGAFFETHVVSEVVKSYLFRGKTVPLFYARDKQGHEVDLVIEDGRNIVLLEVKARATIRDDDALGLRYFLSSYPKGARGCIISLSKERYPLDRNIEVLPVEDID